MKKKRGWNKTSNLIVAIFFSLAFTFIALLNLLGTYAVHLKTSATLFHPLLIFIYWIISLVITWNIYFFVAKKPGKFSFNLAILVGIVFVFLGLFLWFI